MSAKRLRTILAGLLQGIVGIAMFFAFVLTINGESVAVCAALLCAVAAGVLAMVTLHPEDA